MKKTIALVLLATITAGCIKRAPDPVQIRAGETALIQSTVAEPARAERMLDLLTQRDRLIEETTAMLQQYRREMKSLNADYDSSREIVIEMIDHYNRERGQKQLRFIDWIAQMKAATTAAEWQGIAEFQLANFNPRRLVRGRSRGIPDLPNTMLTVFLLDGGLLAGSMVIPDEVDLISEGVELAVDDPVHIATATRILDELKSEVQAFDEIFVDSGNALRGLYLDHTAGSRKILRRLETLNLEWYVSQQRGIKLRERLKLTINADEWAMIFSSD